MSMTQQVTRKATPVQAPCGPRHPAENFHVYGQSKSPLQEWFVSHLKRAMLDRGHHYVDQPERDIRLVLNVTEPVKPVSYRRAAQATFVTTIVELAESPEDIIRTGYPILVRSIANLVVMLVRHPEGVRAHFVTPERGHYTIAQKNGDDRQFFDEIYSRVEPLASSRLVINNVYRTDLEPELWKGDEITREVRRAGKLLDAMNLLPAPFPIHEILDAKTLRHVKRLYGLGGLSYGNLSGRKDRNRFWMSASGVNKAELEVPGQDILLVSGFDASIPGMIISVPPDLTPRRVSVDAIEHFMIYQEHPEVGAIVHVHAWIDGIRSTEVNYPCGTVELAEAVAELVRQEPNPATAVIGLKNHGITITGRSMREIFERVEGKILPQVPMS
jgi:ribulose-5-phosphate 4-epimerase/fuculose-1-phosphate aldolase